MILHVFPIDDLRDHVLVGCDCWCNPEYDEVDDIVTHNSMDGREDFETGKRKLS